MAAIVSKQDSAMKIDPSRGPESDDRGRHVDGRGGLEFAFRTLLVFAIRLPALLPSYALPAPITAIPVAAVAMTANIK